MAALIHWGGAYIVIAVRRPGPLRSTVLMVRCGLIRKSPLLLRDLWVGLWRSSQEFGREECGIVTDEHRPLTIEDVISPVPMNPTFISEKAKCVEIRSALAIVGFPVEDLAGGTGLEAAASCVTGRHSNQRNAKAW